MRRVFFSLILVFIIFLSFSSLVEARSGCCSYHDGVCGCRCCDGTPLSAKCAPYYPECNGNSPEPTFNSTSTPYIPSPTNTPIPLPTSTPTPFLTSTPILTEIPKLTSTPAVLGETKQQSSSNPLPAFGILGVIGYGIYRIFKKKKIDSQ